MSGRVSMDDLVRKVAGKHSMSLVDTKALMDTTFSVIKDAVASGDQVSITKFGSFLSTRSKAYTARNPQNGEPVAVPAKDRVKFRTFEDFKSRVEG